jgi:small conductance mechanosensitive channel
MIPVNGMLATLWDDLQGAFTNEAGTYGGRVLATGIIVTFSWLLVKLGLRAISRSARRLAQRRRLDEYQTQVAISSTKPLTMAFRMLVWILALLATLATWGLTGIFAGLLAGAGFAGIIIGLAAGDVLGDILAGFMLLYRGPFHVGDWVEIDGIQGIVEDVSLTDTTIKTFDNERVSFPNSMVENNIVKNFSVSRKLRIRINVGVEYGTDLAKAKKILVDIAHQQPRIKADPPPSSWVRNFLDSAVELDVRVWIDPVSTSALEIRSDMTQGIHDRFRAEGINIAFPHMQIVQGNSWRVGKDLE